MLYFIFSKVVKQYAEPSKTNPERKHKAFMRNVKESPTQKASSLEELRRVCRPMPLTGKQLEVFFVETDLARDPHQETRRRIKGALEGGETPRVLFYGHRGCGKSTELNKLLAELGDRVFPVTFSAHDEMSPIAVRAEDLVLVVAERVLNAATDYKLGVDENMLKPVLDYFAEEVFTEKECRDSTLQLEGGVSAKDSIVGKLIGLLAKIRGEIKLNVHSDETRIARLRKRPADLLAHANALLDAVRQSLPEDRPLLIVVEDLDKLDMQQAREMFVNNVNLLAGIRAGVVYTIPVFLFHSPDVNAFKFSFDDVVSIPMIKTVEPGGKRAPGFETVREIVLRRVDEKLIEAEALELLIEHTGGVLRHTFETLHTASLMAGASVPLRKENIQYGLRQLQKEFWQQITLPFEPVPGGPESVDELYERLAEYGMKQNKGEKNPPKADPVNQILLKSCALVEYNGEGWLGVHPLVMENLKALGRIS